MPRPKEVSIEDDSIESHITATDEDGIVSQQFETFKRTEYDKLQLSPEKSVLKVLWERVSAEITRRSSNTIQAGAKDSRVVRKPWSSVPTYFEEHPIVHQQLPPREAKTSSEIIWERVSTVIDQKSAVDIQTGLQEINMREHETEQQLTESDHSVSSASHVRESAQLVWDRVSTVIDQKSVVNIQTGLQETNTEEHEKEQQLMESDHSVSPAIHARESTQVVWGRVSSVIDQKSVVNIQDTAPDTGSRDEPEIEEEEADKEKEISDAAHHGTQDPVVEDTTSSVTEVSTSDSAPRGEQEDQESVEECVTTYESPNKEQLRQLEEDVPLDAEPRDMNEIRAYFGNKEIPGRSTGCGEEREVFNKEAEKSIYPSFIVDSQQTRLRSEEMREDAKPQHLLHEDVPKSKTVESLSHISNTERKRDDIEEEEEVPYLSYNPPEKVEKQLLQMHVWDKELRETPHQVTPDGKMEAIRKELEALEGSDDEEDTSLYDAESLKERETALTTYTMPDPVRARIDDEVLLYHVPRSPEPPRRFTEKAFFRFK